MTSADFCKNPCHLERYSLDSTVSNRTALQISRGKISCFPLGLAEFTVVVSE